MKKKKYRIWCEACGYHSRINSLRLSKVIAAKHYLGQHGARVSNCFIWEYNKLFGGEKDG